MSANQNTILVTGPKRAGKTLLLRLFDNHPGILHFLDEAFFWEHAFNYQEAGLEAQFIDLFKHFDPPLLYDAMLERDLLPALNGKFRQFNPIGFETRFKIIDTGFSVSRFIKNLEGLSDCKSIAEIWAVLCAAYASAFGWHSAQFHAAFMMSGDSGKSLISVKESLPKCSCIFIVRDPYLALDSLKISREIRGEKILNPLNLSKAVSYYNFIMINLNRIIHEDTFLIRYEDLIANPIVTMKEISNHCGVEYTENLICPTLMGKPWGTNSIFCDSLGIESSSVSRELKALNRSEIEFISEHTASYLQYFGYPRR